MPKVVQFHETGGPEVLKVEEVPLAEPGKGEVRVAVNAFGLNFAEMMLRRGVYVTDPVFPSRIGVEAAGTIDALGPDVGGFAIGDRVGIVPAQSSDRFGNWTQGSLKYGTYGESTLAPVHAVVRHPENASAAVGGAIWCQYLTAWGGLIEYAGTTADDIVLVTAATSSAGLAGLQVAKEAGATVIAVTRTAAKRGYLLDQAGADSVIVSDDEDLVERVREITSGQGFTVAYDPVGGPYIGQFVAAAQPCARIVNYGNLHDDPVSFQIFPMLAKRLDFKCHSCYDTTRDPDALARGHAYVCDRVESGALAPVIARTFLLDQIADAHRYMEAQMHIGKIVVTT
jgi:NADPH:quinone reductase-like Zn-dependent oxidoreductase